MVNGLRARVNTGRRFVFGTIPLGAYMIAWSTAAVSGLSIYMKYFLLYSRQHGFASQDPGIAILLRSSGLGPDLSLPQRISFFRADLLLAMGSYFLLLLATLVSGKKMPFARSVCVGINTGFFALLFIEFESYRVVKHFVSVNLLLDAFKWGLSHPDGLAAYLRLPSVPLLALGVSLFAITAGFIIRVGMARFGKWLHRHLWPAFAATWIVAFPLVLLTTIAWATPFPSTHYHLGAFELAWSGFWPTRSSASALPVRRSADLVREAFRRETGSPPVEHTSRFGAARSFDVLFFVFETAPTRFVRFDEELPDFPVISSLREHSWIATRHHTTYPTTSAAIFSLFSSMYPPQFLTWFKDKNRKVPGVVRSLREADYDVSAFVPSLELDRTLFSQIGVPPLILPSLRGQPADPSHPDDEWTRRRRLDEVSLEQLKSYIAEHARRNRRYWAVYLPQLGHYPWGPIPEDARMSAAEKGRRIMALQDRWLGELVRLIDREGRLNRTLIVVTSDHGIRSHLEDPEGFSGLPDAASFQVPFLLYGGDLLQKPVVIPWLTSHIDVGPSVLDLLGVNTHREWEQGMPVWDNRLTTRRTYFCAKEMLGGDSFHDLDGRYLMYSYIADTVYINDRLSFGIQSVVPRSSREAEYVQERLRAFDDTEREWLRMAIR